MRPKKKKKVSLIFTYCVMEYAVLFYQSSIFILSKLEYLPSKMEGSIIGDGLGIFENS